MSKQPTEIEWVAEKLKELRNRRGLTLQQTATRIGYNTHSRISDYEMGRYAPTMVTFFALLDALGTSPQDFFRDMPSLKEIGTPTRPTRGTGAQPRQNRDKPKKKA